MNIASRLRDVVLPRASSTLIGKVVKPTRLTLSWVLVGALTVGIQKADSNGLCGCAEGWSDATNTAAGHATMATMVNNGVVGTDNTAVGEEALYLIYTGDLNTGIGYHALYYDLEQFNTAVGNGAMYGTSKGLDDTAIGDGSLTNNFGGGYNTAVGTIALQHSVSGSSNTAVGEEALFAMTSGANNTAIGSFAGSALTQGDDNIFIGNKGTPLSSGAIIIGGSPATQQKTYIAGISSTQVTGAPVFVTASGQLGVLASSERYKTEVNPMGLSTEKLGRLRPVTFHLKSEPEGALQFGLIAEEVNAVYPELVIRDAKGAIQGVRYDELAPMLLNAMQRQQPEYARQTLAAAAQARDLRHLEGEVTQLDDLKRQARTMLDSLRADDQRIALR